MNNLAPMKNGPGVGVHGNLNWMLVYHESLLVLFWSHFKSAIEHFYIKIKSGFDHVFMGFMEVGAIDWFKPSSKIYLLAVPRRHFFCVFLSCVCYAFARLSIDALWSPAG